MRPRRSVRRRRRARAGSAGIDHILAFEQAGNPRLADSERAEDQGAVRDRLVARRAQAAREPPRCGGRPDGDSLRGRFICRTRGCRPKRMAHRAQRKFRSLKTWRQDTPAGAGGATFRAAAHDSKERPPARMGPPHRVGIRPINRFAQRDPHAARPRVPAHRPPLRQAPGPLARARRQVDLASRPDLRCSRRRRDPHLRAARRRGCHQHRKSHARARRPGRAHRRGRVAAAWRRRRRVPRPRWRARFRQFRHRLPPGDGGGRGLPDHRDLRRRRQPAQAADAAHPRPGRAHRRPRRERR